MKLDQYHSNISTCHKCDHHNKAGLCKLANQDIREIAVTGKCPASHFSVAGEFPKTEPITRTMPRTLGISCNKQSPIVPDHAYVINLDRRPERLEAFTAMYAKANFPSEWPTPQRVRAVDASKLPIPPEYTKQAGGYGCMRSHVNVLEDVIQRADFGPCTSVLIFEDDAVVVDGFADELQKFLADVPADWDMLVLGYQQWTPPTIVNDNVLKVTKTQRTHCYMVRGRMIKALYRIWAMSSLHIDWTWHYIQSDYNVYAPIQPLVAQDEGISDIENRAVVRRNWSRKEIPDEPDYFTHSGKLGDLTYALPVLKHFGEATLYLHCRPDADGYRLTERDRDAIMPLLKAQPYIKNVVWSPKLPEGIEDTPLNAFRRFISDGRNIADAHLFVYGLPRQKGKWLEVEPLPRHEVIFSRSARYQNPDFPWKRVWEKYRDRAVFLGLESEHQAFCHEVGFVPYRSTSDLLEAARLIAGCKLFVGNQSCLAAVAEGVGAARIVLEVSPTHNNCQFDREGREHCVDADCDLPELEPKAKDCGCSRGKDVQRREVA